MEAVDPPWDPRRLLRWLRLMEPVGYKRPEKIEEIIETGTGTGTDDDLKLVQ